jgi:uncharacterized membrane protein YgdD (TMEM256/DUF423 family)
MHVFAAIGCLLAAIAVGTGAFGAHGLDGVLTDARMETWETAVRFHMYHALGLIAASQLVESSDTATIGGWVLLGGVVVFSGALYALCLTDISKFGAVAPIGGTALIVGWLILAWAVV